MREWIVAGSGFGLRFESSGLAWIYWAPGTQTQEGAIAWGEKTFGIVPWRANGPRHMHRPENETLADLLCAGLISVLQAEVARRTQPSTADALASWLFENCPHYKGAMLLAKSGILDAPRLIPAFYRHNCTAYTQELSRGGDRITLGLRYHNDLIEILRFYKEHKTEILNCPCDTTALDWHKRLAEVDHTAAIGAVLTENRKRRAQEAVPHGL